MRGRKRGCSCNSAPSWRDRWRAPGLAAACLLAFAPQTLAAEDQKAHTLAEKFATADREAERAQAAKKQAEDERLRAVKAAAEAKRRTEDAKREMEAARRRAEQMKADEAEMLQRARAEADERKAGERRAEEELRRREAERAATEAKLRAEAEAAARAKAEAEKIAAAKAAAERAEKEAAEKAAAEARRRAAEDEAARLAAARAEAEKNAAQRAAAEEQARKQAEMAARHAAEEAALARTKAEEARLAREAEARRLALEEEREAEARRLTEKIRQARAAREARRAPGEEPVFSAPGAVTESVAVGLGAASAARAANPAAAHDTRVTVLLVMEPGNRGIRRFNKSADPMLCVEDSCYIGSGPYTAAKRLSRASAFGPGVALGSRAGACNNSLACVFRDVDLRTASSLIQPIDLRVIRHDRREASKARADETCALSAAGQLSCRATVSTATWRAWIVPETLAARAGGGVLQSAVAAGLRSQEAHMRRGH